MEKLNLFVMKESRVNKHANCIYRDDMFNWVYDIYNSYYDTVEREIEQLLKKISSIPYSGKFVRGVVPNCGGYPF